MLPEELPRCTCGQKKWHSVSALIAPSLQQQSFVCQYCKRAALFLAHAGGHVLLMAAAGTQDMPPTTTTWLNEVLLPVWRHHEELLNLARKVVEKRWSNYACDEVGIARGTTFEEVPESKRTQWQYFFSLLYDYPSYKTPVGFEKPLIPPQIPEGLVAYIKVTHPDRNEVLEDLRIEWEEVSRAESLAQIVPPDPIRVRHDAFISEVLDTLRQNLGINFTTTEIPNKYRDTKSEPWVKFILGGNTFVVGPRKRVMVIQVMSYKGIDTKAIRIAAMNAKTSYYANSVLQSEDTIALTLEVHAWDKKQLLEFLNIIGKESLLEPVS